MLAYTFDDNGFFCGINQCQIDPVRSKQTGETVYLTPRNSVLFPPSEYDAETTIPQWTGSVWELVSLPPKPDPEPNPGPTLEDRVGNLETSTTELQEALDMILTGVTE